MGEATPVVDSNGTAPHRLVLSDVDVEVESRSTSFSNLGCRDSSFNRCFEVMSVSAVWVCRDVNMLLCQLALVEGAASRACPRHEVPDDEG